MSMILACSMVELHHTKKPECYELNYQLAGASTLDSLERAVVGDVAGKRLLHLQCHFGLDTLSWARLGAAVTGVDFSPVAIDEARRLAAAAGLDARFVCADVYRLPEQLVDAFEVVFASHGVLIWLPDLAAWARVVARSLAPGGVFCLVEGHPAMMVFDDEVDGPRFRPRYPYFPRAEPYAVTGSGSYADGAAPVSGTTYEWAHSLGEIVTSLADAGLVIERLDEHSVVAWQAFEFLVPDPDGWRLPDGFGEFPRSFSLRARRPK